MIDLIEKSPFNQWLSNIFKIYPYWCYCTIFKAKLDCGYNLLIDLYIGLLKNDTAKITTISVGQNLRNHPLIIRLLKIFKIFPYWCYCTIFKEKPECGYIFLTDLYSVLLEHDTGKIKAISVWPNLRNHHLINGY